MFTTINFNDLPIDQTWTAVSNPYTTEGITFFSSAASSPSHVSSLGESNADYTGSPALNMLFATGSPVTISGTEFSPVSVDLTMSSNIGAFDATFKGTDSLGNEYFDIFTLQEDTTQTENFVNLSGKELVTIEVSVQEQLWIQFDNFTFSQVPEPASISLIFGLLAGLFVASRKRTIQSR